MLHNLEPRRRHGPAGIAGLPWAWPGFVLAALLVAGSAAAQTSKRVGVVFDDSGSMKGRTNLPVFGIQMLVASLTRNDKLYGLTFKQFYEKAGQRGFSQSRPDKALREAVITELRFGSDEEQRRRLREIMKWAENPDANTPYPPVHFMLAHLAENASRNEDVHLFVFTDGDFNETDRQGRRILPPLAELEADYTHYKAVLDSKEVKSFTVHFIAFAPNPDDEKKMRKQGIAFALDDKFNGGRREDVYFVKNFNGLREKLVQIVARIADTEPEAKGQSAGQTVVRGDRKLTVTPPFTITRMVAVSTAPAGTALPQVGKLPPGVQTKTEFLPEMERADEVAKAGLGADTRWTARVTRMDALPALAAGQPFDLEFDQAIDDTTVLFRSDIKVEWDIVDETGAIVPVGAGNVISVSAEHNYEVRARIEDRDPKNRDGPPIEATFQHLPRNTEFTFLPRRPGGPVERFPMEIDKAQNRAIYKFRPKAPTSLSAQVSIAVPGFVTQRGRDIKINVVKTDFRIKLAAEPLIRCARCSPSRVEAPLTQADPWRPAMKVTASFEALGTLNRGDIEFKLQNPLPKGVQAQIAGARTVLEGSRTSVRMPVSASDTVEAVFEFDGSFLESLPEGHKVLLSATAVPPLVGSGSLNFQLVPLPEQAQLLFSGTTDGAVGDTPFRTRPEGLAGRSGFFIKVDKAYGTPALDDFRIDIGGLKHTAELQPSGDVVLVKPVPGFWCNCFVATGRREIQARFKNKHGQEAALTGHMFVEEITLLERIVICLTLIIATFTTLWIVWGLWRLLISHRFPRRSRLMIYSSQQRNLAIMKRLAKPFWPWIQPFVLPFKNCDERTDVEGLRLQAMSGGVRVLPKRGAYTTIHRAHDRRSLADVLKAAPFVEIFWGARLQRQDARAVMLEFVERRGA